VTWGRCDSTSETGQLPDHARRPCASSRQAPTHVLTPHRASIKLLPLETLPLSYPPRLVPTPLHSAPHHQQNYPFQCLHWIFLAFRTLKFTFYTSADLQPRRPLPPRTLWDLHTQTTSKRPTNCGICIRANATISVSTLRPSNCKYFAVCGILAVFITLPTASHLVSPHNPITAT
jgi:hypothetical protein